MFGSTRPAPRKKPATESGFCRPRPTLPWSPTRPGQQSDTLHVAAAALGSRVVRQAADSYARAARVPSRAYSRDRTPTGNGLRHAARLLPRPPRSSATIPFSRSDRLVDRPPCRTRRGSGRTAGDAAAGSAGLGRPFYAAEHLHTAAMAPSPPRPARPPDPDRCPRLAALGFPEPGPLRSSAPSETPAEITPPVLAHRPGARPAGPPPPGHAAPRNRPLVPSLSKRSRKERIARPRQAAPAACRHVLHGRQQGGEEVRGSGNVHSGASRRDPAGRPGQGLLPDPGRQLRSIKIGKLRRITDQHLAEFVASHEDLA